MAKRVDKISLKKSRVVWGVAFAVLFLAIATLVPIETMSYSGGCRSEANRLSLILQGPEIVKKTRETIEKRNQEREERRKNSPLISDGCSPGLRYNVYIL